MRPTTFLHVLLLCSCAALFGCGDDDGGSDASSEQDASVDVTTADAAEDVNPPDTSADVSTEDTGTDVADEADPEPCDRACPPPPGCDQINCIAGQLCVPPSGTCCPSPATCEPDPACADVTCEGDDLGCAATICSAGLECEEIRTDDGCCVEASRCI